MISPVDRFRRLPPAARRACFEALSKTPGALADVRYDFEGFWAHEHQRVSVEELEAARLVVFAGPRGQGKTEAAVQLFIREIHAGRATRPRIFAANEADVDKVVVHGISGIMAALPKSERPRWVASEGPAGVLRFRNGTEALCFSARVPDAAVAHAGDLDLYDDVAKWPSHTAMTAWAHADMSLRVGYACGIVATTRRGTTMLRKLLDGKVDGVLMKRPTDLRVNRFNLSRKMYNSLLAEIGGTDLLRQELYDEDISASSPFAGLNFDVAPIRVFEAPRGSFAEVVVCVDPSDGKGGGHDDWGIGAAGRRHDRHVVALDDETGQYDDDEAGAKVIEMAERWGARKVIVERNRGEKRVASVIKAAHYKRRYERGDDALVPLPEIIGVTAKEAKKLRAGPLRALYLEGMLHHVAGLAALERQQREWEPDGPKRPRQDDHIDWWVHAVMHLAGLEAGAGATAADQLEGMAEATARALRAARGETMLSRERPNPLGEVMGARGAARWGRSGGGNRGRL